MKYRIDGAGDLRTISIVMRVGEAFDLRDDLGVHHIHGVLPDDALLRQIGPNGLGVGPVPIGWSPSEALKPPLSFTFAALLRDALMECAGVTKS